MQTDVAKTTLYFDRSLYKEIKRIALDEGKTITQVIQDTVRKSIHKVVPIKKKPFKSKLPPGIHLGGSHGKYKNFSREEIYDFI